MIQPKLYSLSNGIPVIIDSLPGFESATVGIYVKNGSRNESSQKEFGMSHMLEHMAFKGTTTRSAREITDSIENVGGVINAYTTFNMTAYFSTVPVRHREIAFDILSDIVKNSVFPESEMIRERSVVAQEIKSYQDIPEAILEKKMFGSIFRGGMQHDIGGDIKSVGKISRDNLIEYFKSHYSAKNSLLVLSGGGLENPEPALAALEKYFGDWKKTDVPEYKFSTYVPAVVHMPKLDLSHTYFKLVWPTPPANCRTSLQALNLFMFIMGAGFGSRMFQEIREKRGLVYYIGAGGMAFEDVGIAVIEAQTESCKMAETICAIADLRAKILTRREPITEAELSRAKEMTKGGILMGLESSSRRADFFATRSMRFGGLDDLQTIIDKLDAVTLEGINAAAREMFSEKPSIITLGVEKKLPAKEWQGLF